jgi:hypothetical protein
MGKQAGQSTRPVCLFVLPNPRLNADSLQSSVQYQMEAGFKEIVTKQNVSSMFPYTTLVTQKTQDIDTLSPSIEEETPQIGYSIDNDCNQTKTEPHSYTCPN